MTVRLVADTVFTVDDAGTVLTPGAVEMAADGTIAWVGDPRATPAGPGTEVRDVGGLFMPGLVNCHAALAHDAGAQRRRRAAPRPVAQRIGVAPRGAA